MQTPTTFARRGLISTWAITMLHAGTFSRIFSSADLFAFLYLFIFYYVIIIFLQKKPSESECQTVSIQFSLDILLGLIWVQSIDLCQVIR